MNKKQQIQKLYNRLKELNNLRDDNLDNKMICFLIDKECIISVKEYIWTKEIEQILWKDSMRDFMKFFNFFNALRHLLIHFPIFNTEDDIFFDYNMIDKADPYSFITDYMKKWVQWVVLKYSPYNEKQKPVIWKIKSFKLEPGKKIFLKDIVSIEKNKNIYSILYIFNITYQMFLQEYMKLKNYI